MAWLIGLANKAEIAELERRGWTVDDLRTCIHEMTATDTENHTDKMVGIFVDNDLLAIASGPDWVKAPETPLAVLETLEILEDADALKMLQQSLADIRAGHLHDHEDIEKEMLDEAPNESLVSDAAKEQAARDSAGSSGTSPV